MPIRTAESLEENFKFLALEVAKQVRSTTDILEGPKKETVARVVSRDDYIDNLKTIIENKCFSQIHGGSRLDRREINRIRAIHIICVNLERIADFCVNVIQQLDYFSDPAFIRGYDYRSMFDTIEEALGEVIPVLDSGNLARALAICKAEFDLDLMYKECFHKILDQLSTGKQVGDLVTTLYIFRYLERIGDSLLNIGEAAIFAFLGEKIKIHQFQALQQTLSDAGYDASISEIDFQSIWGGRSGCRISRVQDKVDSAEKPREVIFKEGNLDKIRTEKKNTELWGKLFPGYTPRVVGFQETRETASMLVEFMPGCTMEEVVLTSDWDNLKNALFILEQVLTDLWEETKAEDPVASHSLNQIWSRLDSIRQVHPELLTSGKRIGAAAIPSLENLLKCCEASKPLLQAPFSVLTHGDLNLNNIVYDFSDQRIRFIDLYRSAFSDYVQDVSVFLVSNFRIPAFEPLLRERLNWATAHFFHFAQEFAVTHGDHTFKARLALALARSFLTSTRFELDDTFARDMFLRGRYLLKHIAASDVTDWKSFTLPESILYY